MAHPYMEFGQYTEFMPRFLDKLYSRIGEPKLLDFVSTLKEPIQFVVEAGCHDGADTLTFLEDLKIQKVYAFEPDPLARLQAANNLDAYLHHQVLLSSNALSNRSGAGEIIVDGSLGNGSSQIISMQSEESESVKIKTIPLDDVSIVELENGFLWLDVEGHAVQALEGAEKSLRKIDLAKIEVQMHSMSANRPADAFQVIYLLRKAGLVPIYLPIHPGFFGDIYFIRQSKMRLHLRFLGKIRFYLFAILHKVIYPLLNKPRFQ